MKFSIVVPVYFYNEFVERTLTSLFRQQNVSNNLEIIIVINSVSIEDYKIIENKLNVFISDVNKFNVIYKIIYTAIKGANNARKIGVDNSDADYVMFMDSDDILVDDNTLGYYLNYLSNEPNIDIMSFNFINAKIVNEEMFFSEPVYKFNQDGIILKSKNDTITITKNFGTNIWGRIIKKDVIKDISFPELPYFQDWNISSKIYLNSTNFIFIDKPLYAWIYREDSISHKGSDDEEKFKKAFESIKDSIEYFKLNKQLNNIFIKYRIIHFCFQYLNRGKQYSFNEAFKKCKALLNENVSINDVLKLDLKTIIMYLSLTNFFTFNLINRLRK